MKKYLILNILFLAISLKGVCQMDDPNLPNFNPPSPEASALGKYVEHPVGYFTGTPQIEIPLFTIKCGRITLPISISYHASGVKVDEIASRIGTGWVLNAGGVITRSLKGQFNDDCYMGFFGGLYLSSVQNNTYDGNYYDFEPDPHFYNFNGHTGKMYFADKTHPYALNKEPIKIDGPYNGSNKFVITTEDGLIYTFEAVESSSIYRQSFIGTGFSYNSSWYLTKIDDPVTGKNIQFEYRTDMTIPLNYNHTISYSEGMSCNSEYAGGQFIESNTIQTPKVLSKIIYDAGYIVLKADHDRLDLTGDKAYTEIDQYEGYNEFKTGFAFNYVYTSNGSAQENKRLYLESLTEKKNSVTTLPPYQFYYKNRDLLPERGSVHQDVWGYYNANTALQSQATDYAKVYVHPNSGKITYLPFDNNITPATTTVSGVDRASNTLTIDYGTLNKVVYPTKGYTTYEYEIHKFDQDTYSGGGIRIHKINDYLADNSLQLSKEYIYSNGLLGGAYPQVAYPYNNLNGSGLSRFSLNASALGSSQGSYVGYGIVKEKQISASGNNGFTEYRYSQNKDVEGTFLTLPTAFACLNTTDVRLESDFPFFEMESREARRGMLLSKSVWDNSVPSQKIKETTYSYTVLTDVVTPVYSFRLSYPGHSHDGGHDGLIVYSRNINAEKMLLNSKTETTYPGLNTPMEETTTYAYTDIPYQGNFIREETHYVNGGNYVGTTYTYPFDYPATASDGAMGIMVSMNYINPVISKIQKTTGASTLSYYTYGQINSYTHNPYYPTGTNPNSILPAKVYALNSTTPLQINPTNTAAVVGVDPAYPGSLFDERLHYLNYDSYGNLLSASKPNNPTINYIWGYGGKYLVAQITNANYNSIVSTLGGQTNIESFRNNFTPSYELVNSFTALLRNSSNLPNAQVISYTHNPILGVTSITDARNNSTFYEYDNFHRLKDVKDQNGNIMTSYCYNYAGDPVGCLVPATPVPPDPIPNPPVGIYLRVEINNINYEYYGDGDEYSSFQTGDVCVKMYSDPACTIPLTLSYNLPFVMTQGDNILDDMGGDIAEPDYGIYTLTAGNNSYCLGTMDLDDLSHYLDEFGNPHYTEYVYHYDITPGSTVYRDRATITN